jgi:hypothetical protein
VLLMIALMKRCAMLQLKAADSAVRASDSRYAER